MGVSENKGGEVPYFGVRIIRILLFRVLYLGPLFSATPRCAAEAGSLDSFQFQYDWDVPENVEIVAVNLQGVYPCGTAASGRVAAFRSGWMASSPCDCDNAARDGFLNCNLNQTVARVRGIGSSTSFATFHSEAVTSAVTGALVVSVALAVCTVFGKKIAGDPRPNVPHQDLSSAETCREYLLKIGWMMAQLLLAGVSLGIVS